MVAIDFHSIFIFFPDSDYQHSSKDFVLQKNLIRVWNNLRVSMK